MTMVEGGRPHALSLSLRLHWRKAELSMRPCGVCIEPSADESFGRRPASSEALKVYDNIRMAARS